MKRQIEKEELKFLRRYVQILKLHNKEELTQEEKDELITIRDNGKSLVSQLTELKKKDIKFFNSCTTSKFLQDKE